MHYYYLFIGLFALVTALWVIVAVKHERAYRSAENGLLNRETITESDDAEHT